MSILTRNILLMLLCLPLVACEKPAKATSQTNNSQFDVDYLFTQGNCSIYRFYDAGHYRYFVTCNGSTETTVQQGKTTRPESISTGVVSGRSN